MPVEKPSFFSEREPRLLLFGGKGGVGKTSCATATALNFAGRFPRKAFLLVSTDPAHSLEDSLDGATPPPNLKVLELNAQEYLAAFKQEHSKKLEEIAYRGTFLDRDDISQFLDLSLPGLDELMAFLEISRWVREESYACIVVDTAPTGHTLQLLAMPDTMRKFLDIIDTLLAKHRYMKRLYKGVYIQDDLDEFLLDLSGLVNQMTAILQDSGQCQFVPVMLPEELSIEETLSLVETLQQLKMPVNDIIINKIYSQGLCPVCADRQLRQMKRLAALPQKFSGHLLWSVFLQLQEVHGMANLKAFWNNILPLETVLAEFKLVDLKPAPRLPAVENPGMLPVREASKLLIFAGKGGVGKTTLACSTAIRLARDFAGKEILLFSTDPAHSLSACLKTKIGSQPTRLASGLTAMEIDAKAEFEILKKQYAEELESLLTAFLPNLDLTFDHEVMKRIIDLSPPGLDEIMALTLAMKYFSEGKYDIFIFDTAPTGHLIRLLEMPELIDQWLKVFFGLLIKYKSIFRLPKVSGQLVDMSKNLKKFRALLKNKTSAAVYVVAILTEMAFHETRDLVAACDRMEVDTPLLFLNLATPKNKCSQCSALHDMETQVYSLYRQAFSGKHQTIVYCQGEPLGLSQLGELGQALYQQAPLNKTSTLHKPGYR